MDLLNRILAEDDMPEILHDSACSRIAQGCIHQPAVEPDVMRQGSFQDLISRDCELSTTGHTNLFRDDCGVEQVGPCLSKGILGRCFVLVYPSLLFLIAEWLNLCRIAAWCSVASEVCVTVLLNEVDVQQL